MEMSGNVRNEKAGLIIVSSWGTFINLNNRKLSESGRYPSYVKLINRMKTGGGMEIWNTLSGRKVFSCYKLLHPDDFCKTLCK